MSTASIEEEKNTTQEKDDEVLEEKAPAATAVTEHIYYDKATLLKLRSSPAAQERPVALSEEFLIDDDTWDPEAWHSSKASRTSSPMVDQKNPDGKRKEQMDDGIELAPHRRSFQQGCHVSMTYDGSGKPEKHTRSMFEKKNRLTGRASGQRKNMESNFREHGDGNSGHYGDYEKTKRERYSDRESRGNRFDKFADKENRQPNRDGESGTEKEKYDSSREHRKERDNENRPNERRSKANKHLHPKSRHGREMHEENLPEWMTDGPTSQLDTVELSGFKDIEEEKKAYANARNKKKVRISPDIERQTMKAANSSTPPPSKNASKEDITEKLTNDEKPRKETKSPSNFDISEFFSEVNFYPPCKVTSVNSKIDFHDDIPNANGIRSRFTQYFQSKGRGNSCSPDGAIPDEVFLGVHRKSPGVPVPYFTPIQPAVSPVPMVPPVAAPFVNFIHEQAAESKKVNKEIKGRLNVEELEEAIEKNDVCALEEEFEHGDMNQSAFNLLVQSMKNAGQLPDKPCPVVTGLPNHLLPQPPRKSSPTFEKLKRSLSRSPSPKEFMRAVSTVASILVTNPSIESEIALKKNSIQLPHPTPVRPVSPDLIEEEEYVNGISTGNRISSNEDETPAGNSSLNASFGTSSTPQVHRLPTAFLPTSVLKKMHSEKQRGGSPTNVQQQTPDKTPPVNGHDSPFSDLLVNSVRSPKPSPRESHHLSEHTISAFDNLSLAGQLNLSNIDSDDALFHNSAPPTPRHSISNNHPVALPPHSNSAPNTPEHKFRSEPPPIQHLNIQPPGLNSMQSSHFTKPSQPLMVPSAFHAPIAVKPNQTNDFGAIGSGMRQKGMRENEDHMEAINHQSNLDGIDRLRGFADPRLAPGNGVVRNTRNVHSPINNSIPTLSNHSIRTQTQNTCLPPNHLQQSQQQQLLQAQRMAQIHQAQLHQQQKLQQIANQAKLMQQQKQSNLQGRQFSAPGVRPLLPDPETNSLQQQKRPGEQQSYQQQQRQQIQAFHQQRQQQQQQQQMSQQQQPRTSSAFSTNGGFRGGRHFPNQNPEITRNSPPMPLPLHQHGLQAFQNLNRPQGMQNVNNLAAQALVQQQLLSQADRARFIAQTQLLQQQPQVVQALMAQAALVRGQAQAQAAMMFNQKNIQAMAQQMGIRHPAPHVNNKNIPTPMINNQGNHQQPQSNNLGNFQNGTLPNAASADGLSKWFGKDVLNLLLQNNVPPTELTTGKVMSVEELERKQRSS